MVRGITKLSTDVQVGAHYDDSIPCSKALGPGSKCNPTSGNIACGYGLACIAKNVREARCLPVCQSQYSRRRFGRNKKLQKFFLGVVAAGCKEDGQKRKRKYRKYGKVLIDKKTGIAAPSCTASVNIGSTNNVAKPSPEPPTMPPTTPPKPPAEAPIVTKRKELARQIVGLGNVYYEGKRAGLEPRDSDLFPQVRTSFDVMETRVRRANLPARVQPVLQRAGLRFT